MTDTAAAPRTYLLTDAELRTQMERLAATAQTELDAVKAKMVADFDFTYNVEWMAASAVQAQTRLVMLSRALNAPDDKLRSALAAQLGQTMGDSSRGDAWRNAVTDEKRTAARKLLGLLSSELDASEVLSQLV
jgi:hypothetical protein